MKQPHINCDADDVHSRVIVCGDPARVERIAAFGDNPRFISSNREFTVYETFYNGLAYTICSTGIGGPSAAIAVEELIKCGAQAVIRVGSAGALQGNVVNGDIVIAEGAVRNDGASRMYVATKYPAIADYRLVTQLSEFVQSTTVNCHQGIVYTHDSFYTNKEEEICNYWSEMGIIAKEMETATILTVARLRNIRAAAIMTIVVEFYANKLEGINAYKNAQSDLINSENVAINAAFYALSKMTLA